MWCFKNAQPVASVALQDRAFQYGDGCFSTARIVKGQLQLVNRHYERLNYACQQLGLNVDLKLIEQSLKQLTHQEIVLTGTLKLLISRGEGPRGYSVPDHNADLYVFFYPQAYSDTAPQYVEVGLLPRRIGLTMPDMVGIKTLNRLEQVLLKQQADQYGWAEALVADLNGNIVEGVSSNCFIYLNNAWITPELRYNGVRGLMRTEILDRAQQAGIDILERQIHLDELDQVQALFFCNTLHPMTIASRMHSRSLSTEACLTLFHTLKLNQID